MSRDAPRVVLFAFNCGIDRIVFWWNDGRSSNAASCKLKPKCSQQFTDCNLNDVQDHLSLCSWATRGSCQLSDLDWIKQRATPKDSNISVWRKEGRPRTSRDVTGHMLTLAGVPSPEVILGDHVVFLTFVNAPHIWHSDILFVETQGKKPSVT